MTKAIEDALQKLEEVRDSLADDDPAVKKDTEAVQASIQRLQAIVR